MVVPLLDVPSVPLHASAPVPPLAVQEVALTETQAREMLCPTGTVFGVA
jgi:hypothetical protein